MMKAWLGIIVCIGFAVFLAVTFVADRRDRGMKFRSLQLEEVFPDPGARDLALAAAKDQTGRIDELLAQGVDINYQGKHGITPLMWALLFESHDGFSSLLKRGADPNVKFRDNWQSVMHSTAYAGKDSRFLIEALRHGGNANLVDSSRPYQTPVFNAIIGDGTENLQILLDAGADPNYKMSGGETAIFTAALIEDYEAAYLLVQYGADPTIQDVNGRTMKYWMMKHPERFDEYAHKLLDLIADKERAPEKE